MNYEGTHVHLVVCAVPDCLSLAGHCCMPSVPSVPELMDFQVVYRPHRIQQTATLQRMYRSFPVLLPTRYFP